MRAIAILTAIALAAPFASARSAVPTRVVVASGTVVDGLGLARFTEAVGLGSGRAVVRASSERVVIPDSNGARTIVATGDRLPQPYGGTFNTFVQADDTGDGLVVFEAELNDSEVDFGLFVVDGTRVEALATERRTALNETSLTSFSLAASGHVAWSDGGAVYRWTRLTRTTIVLDPLDGVRLTNRPLVDPTGSVAWLVDSADGFAGVRRWTEADGTQAVVARGMPSPLGGATYTSFQPSAIGTSEVGIAFFAETDSTTGVFLWRTATGATELVARVGDPVDDGTTIAQLRAPIFVTADGRVVFRARLSNRRLRYVEASGGGLFVSRRPHTPHGTADVEIRDGLFAADAGRVKPVLRQGDPLPDGGTVTSIGVFAADATTVAAVVYRDDGTFVLVSVRGDRVRTVATSGAPIGDLESATLGSALDVRAKGIAFAADPFGIVKRGRRVSIVAPPEGLAFDEAFFIEALHQTDRGLVVGGRPSAGLGIYAADGDRFVPVITTGDQLAPPANVTIGDVYTVVPTDRSIAFVAGAGGSATIFVKRGGRVMRLSSSAPDAGGAIVDRSPYDLRYDGNTALFRDGDTIFEARPRRAVAVFGPGITTSAGTVSFADTGYGRALAVTDGELVVSSRLLGGGVAEALLARRVGRRPP